VDERPARRAAGFEAVGLLDKTGRYREAFDLAVRVHADTTPPFDLEGFLQAPREHATKAASGAKWVSARAEPVQSTALVVGLPRSGTTLLEQMLDRHPAISGIGEYEGLDALGAGFPPSPPCCPARSASMSRAIRATRRSAPS
jgi:hypothetical protein